jgi:hypothetical protein
MVVGGLADSAGLRSVHSQRCAAANAPDKMLWMPRIVLAFIGWQTCGLHPARRQSWPGPGRLRLRRGSPLGSPATTVARPCRAMIRPSAVSVSRACRMTPVPMPCRALSSVIDGSSSPGREDPGPDRLCERLSDLLPGRARVARDRSPGPGRCGAPCGHVPRGDRRVLVQEFGHGRVGLGRAALGCFFQQPAELDMGLLLGLDGGLQPDRAPGDRIGPGVHPDPERPAQQLLYVTFGDPRHGNGIAPVTDIRSTKRSTYRA